MKPGERTDDGIGRLLVASLHQAIGDAMPLRLEYYEHWLGPMGLRDGRGGLARFGAVLSFLRQEGQPLYDDIMTRAGHASAEWRLVDAAGPRRVARWLPRRLRRRYALVRGGDLARAAFDPVRTTIQHGRGRAVVKLDGSPFCALRGTWPWPTCTYFAAAIAKHAELCGAPAAVHIESCRATGDGACRLAFDFTTPPTVGDRS